MIVIYCPQLSPRLEYAASILFEFAARAAWRITTNPSDLGSGGDYTVNYSDEQHNASLQIIPEAMVFEDFIRAVDISPGGWDGVPVLFSRPNNELPFDIFAATFFLASRYEEYLPFEPDEHGRFQASQSVAFNQGFLQTPLIQVWAQKWVEMIRTKAPDTAIEFPEFSAVHTFDIDVAWAYKHKGFWRTAAAVVNDLISFNHKRLTERLAVLRGALADPYDTYHYLAQQVSASGWPAHVFFLLGDYSRRDRNSSHKSPAMRQLILETRRFSEVGIHPSYGSHKSAEQLKKEINRLKSITGEKVETSRQHYLKMTLPETYRRLIDAGIERDFTLGYAQNIGFRASLSVPFYFFDLKANRVTGLLLFPLACMDGTLRQYMNLSPDAAISEVKRLIDQVKKYGGVFITLWHNSSLCESGEWKGWRNVFETSLRMTSDNEIANLRQEN